MERRRKCIEALKQLATSDDSNRDEVVRMRVKDCIEPEASDLRKQLQGLSEDIHAEVGIAPGEDWSYAKVFVQSMLRYVDTEMSRCAEAESGLRTITLLVIHPSRSAVCRVVATTYEAVADSLLQRGKTTSAASYSRSAASRSRRARLRTVARHFSSYHAVEYFTPLLMPGLILKARGHDIRKGH